MLEMIEQFSWTETTETIELIEVRRITLVSAEVAAKVVTGGDFKSRLAAKSSPKLSKKWAPSSTFTPSAHATIAE